MTGTLIRGKHVVTRVLDRHKVEMVDDGAVYALNGRVVEVAPFAELARRHPTAAVLGDPGWVILPGFVNGHHHVGLTPLQLGSPDYALELWFAGRFGARRVDLYLDTLYSAFEMIESGITTVQHLHGWIPGRLNALMDGANAIIRAYEAIGMRVSYSFAVRDQNRLVYENDADFVRRLPPELQPAMAAHFAAYEIPLEEFFQLFSDLRAQHLGKSRTRIQLAPANLHWCSDHALERLAQVSAETGTPLHMHLLETVYQKEYARRRTGGTALQHLHKLGLTGPRLTLGHGVWLSEADLELAAATGTCVCHNCSSNLRLRSGVLPLNELERRGMTVALGLDEAGINDDRDMLQEMRLALRLHRTPGMDDSVPTCPQVLRMATEHGARTTPFKHEVGTLTPGMGCDLVALDWHQVSYPFLDPEVEVIDAVVQRAKTQGVRLVMVEGEPVYDGGRFTRIDKDAVLAELADRMARPPTEEELRRRALGKAIFPHVKAFYDGYHDGLELEPFYRPSSRS